MKFDTTIRNQLSLSDFCNKSEEFTITLTQVNLGAFAAVAVSLNGEVTYHNTLADALNYIASNVMLTAREKKDIVELMR